ncbi:hypothetical protein J4T90_20395 [Sinorhizobium medicae]|uniref:hypothetical protein n=1 Tax=Sinorhizobium medicae TaxID=110321 RepID=UPI001AAD91A2|nr:hypothetical protein [Sinorhizobium medicae]MBO1939972.1 hypothetical protein [Sinorhizobium medicae]
MHIGKYFGLSAAFIVGGCATSETMVLKPYRLENGVVLQDVVTVGGNGKGTAPVVTAVKTFELAGNKTRLVHSASGSEGSMGSAVARAVASGVAAGVPAAVAQVIANRADGERITVSNSNSSSPVNTGLSGILCGGPVSSVEEPLAKDDGELCLCLDPFPRRPFPLLGRVVKNEI